MMLYETSTLPRFGIKGRAAGIWLASQNIPLPAEANRWLSFDNHRVLRLGRSEYLVEGEIAHQLAAAWQPSPDMFFVPRHDGAFVLAGKEATHVMQEICALDTRPEAIKDQVLMTLVAGISATVVCASNNDAPLYRLWCDGTYADYLRGILNEIVLELGGATIGLQNPAAKSNNSLNSTF
jgi:sarcosine oxidase subunit gamma